MNWAKPKIELKTTVVDFKKFGSNSAINESLKNTIINENKKVCMFCGGTYKTFMFCYHESESIVLACKLCYAIRNLNYNKIEFDIYSSNMSQTDIVRSTVDFIVKHNSIPTALQIDKNIKQTEMTKFEYINLVNNDKYSDIINNIKVFVTQDFDFNYLLNTVYTFIDDD